MFFYFSAIRPQFLSFLNLRKSCPFFFYLLKVVPVITYSTAAINNRFSGSFKVKTQSVETCDVRAVRAAVIDRQPTAFDESGSRSCRWNITAYIFSCDLQCGARIFQLVGLFYRLVLEWNALGMWEEGFSVFCEGLASNTSLIQLDLRNNQINHQGAAEIALALKRNSVLRGLGGCWWVHTLISLSLSSPFKMSILQY